jgi:hypothetical protein
MRECCHGTECLLFGIRSNAGGGVTAFLELVRGICVVRITEWIKQSHHPYVCIVLSSILLLDTGDGGSGRTLCKSPGVDLPLT